MAVLRYSVVCGLWMLGSVVHAAVDAPRSHAYAFDQPELLATQRVFGVGNAVTLLGEACIEDAKAADSYAEWGERNQATLSDMTVVLAAHYRLFEPSGDLQQRVAEAMHLNTKLTLSNSALTEACASLPATLAQPTMDLAQRYQSILREVSDPNYTNPRKQKKNNDREDQTSSQ